MSQIRFENVNYIYSGGTTFEKQALKDVSFAVESGSFIGVIGHTGSGKSTLIQHMNGLIRPTSGKIYFHDEDITADGYKKKELRSKVGRSMRFSWWASKKNNIPYHLLNYQAVRNAVWPLQVFWRCSRKC